MAEYRRKDLDLSTRIALGLEMLHPIGERDWGRASELAREYGISRSWLYRLKDRAQQALEAAMAPGQVGRPAKKKTVQIDRDYLRRAIAVMPLLTGSVRNIQMGLELLFDVRRSVGYISQTLQAAGAAAEAQNGKVQVRLPVLGEADEIFAGRKPCLTVVDGRSFLALNLSAADGRDATRWGLTFLDLEARGVTFHDLAADGACGIRAGLQEAKLAVPLRPDLFHLLRAGKRLQNRLEKKAYKAIRKAERAKRAEQEARQPKKRSGRPLKVNLSAAEAAQKATQAVDVYDHFSWLLSEVRQALEPLTGTHRLLSPIRAQETLETAINLLQTLPDEKLSGFAKHLSDHMEELLAPLVWLHETLTPWRKDLPPTLEASILACWQSGCHSPDPIPSPWRKTAIAFWDALALFHRSSSLAEALHSWLRPYLSIHRGMPDWLLPLLQLFWNHHVFSRGKRTGHSPLQFAGIDDPPSLASVFDNLFVNPASA